MTLFQIGFRTFFLLASVFATLSIALWLGIFSGHLAPLSFKLPATYIHAHEMVFGYTFAVIAGFLLTAVRNWTGLPTPQGPALIVLAGFWLVARLAWLMPDSALVIALCADMSFSLALMIGIATPIVKTKQWRQMAILSKVALLSLANLWFYLGAFGVVAEAWLLTLYGGVFLVIGLILTIGRRVFPMFIQNGVDYPVTLFNARWIDLGSLFGFLAFFIVELFFDLPLVSQTLAAFLFVITTIRIIGWYTPGVWRSPLLWSLLGGLVTIDLGFLLYALQAVSPIPDSLALHAFAYGGIGVITLSMMARVSLGHTGRNLKAPPATVFWALVLLCAGTLLRCVTPLFAPELYTLWIGLAGACWVLSFLSFAVCYAPIWMQPRVDGKPG